VAGDGRSGVYLAQQYQLKGVILDLGLPDMTGFEVLKKVSDDSV